MKASLRFHCRHRDAGATRATLAKVLGTRTVDAGGGWLIVALPPAELAVHSA